MAYSASNAPSGLLFQNQVQWVDTYTLYDLNHTMSTDKLLINHFLWFFLQITCDSVFKFACFCWIDVAIFELYLQHIKNFKYIHHF